MLLLQGWTASSSSVVQHRPAGTESLNGSPSFSGKLQSSCSVWLPWLPGHLQPLRTSPPPRERAWSLGLGLGPGPGRELPGMSADTGRFGGGEELLSCSQISDGAPRCCSTFLLLLFLPGAPPSGCFSATARFFLPLLFLGASAPASSFAVWPPEEVRPRSTASSAAGAVSAPPPGATGGDPGCGLWGLAGLEADLLLPGT